ncbi:MAG: HAD-IA family hydrolase [Candidatus Pacearchaeota archaeon]
MKIKLLIFDFDGTLANTKNLWYNTIKKYLKKEGISFSKKDFHTKFLGIKVEEILKKLKIKNKEKIKKQIHKEVFYKIKKVNLAKSINYLKKIKVKKIIISNTTTKNVLSCIKSKKINYFKEIYGGDKFENKEEFIKEYIKNNKLNKDEVVYIGDTIRDIRLAKKIGCISIVIVHNISWNNKKELLRNNPSFVIESFKDLKDLIKRKSLNE